MRSGEDFGTLTGKCIYTFGGNGTDCLASAPQAMMARLAAEPWEGGVGLFTADGLEDDALTTVGSQ